MDEARQVRALLDKQLVHSEHGYGHTAQGCLIQNPLSSATFPTAECIAMASRHEFDRSKKFRTSPRTPLTSWKPLKLCVANILGSHLQYPYLWAAGKIDR